MLVAVSFKSEVSAVIPIGGKGSRLKEITSEIPKPIYPIEGKSTLYRCCEELKKYGITKIFITTGYKSDLCKEHIKEIERTLNLSIYIFLEKDALGMCALWEIKDLISDDFIFINGDLIFSISWHKLLYFHKRVNSTLTLVTHLTDHPYDSDLISAPNGSLIKEIYLKNDESHKKLKNAYLGNAGISVINKSILEYIDRPKSLINSSLFHHLVKKGFDSKLRIYSYNTTEYIKDMGTPDRFLKVKKDIQNNLLEEKTIVKSKKFFY